MKRAIRKIMKNRWVPFGRISKRPRISGEAGINHVAIVWVGGERNGKKMGKRRRIRGGSCNRRSWPTWRQKDISSQPIPTTLKQNQNSHTKKQNIHNKNKNPKTKTTNTPNSQTKSQHLPTPTNITNHPDPHINPQQTTCKKSFKNQNKTRISWWKNSFKPKNKFSTYSTSYRKKSLKSNSYWWNWIRRTLFRISRSKIKHTTLIHTIPQKRIKWYRCDWSRISTSYDWDHRKTNCTKRTN